MVKIKKDPFYFFVAVVGFISIGFLGTIFSLLTFSLSILILSFQSISNSNFGWLGPLTPIGGLLLISGWIILLYSFIREK